MDSDDAIRKTDDDAVVSRLSAVSLGYLKDDFAKFFVKRPVKRTPIINRGTYLRTKVLDDIVEQFLELVNGPCQICILGAGSDTRFWRMSLQERNVQCFEIDFPENTSKKAMSIFKNSSLKQLIEPVQVLSGGTRLTSPKYHLIPGDLRQWVKVVTEMTTLGFSDKMPTLFISECVLIYMEPEESDALISWISKMPSLFVSYEQISPDDAFGKMMVQNLRARNIELRGVRAYPNVESQRQRYLSAGFIGATAIDMNQCFNQYVSSQEKERISQVEMLDEVEEWILLSKHYCLSWAWTIDKFTSIHP